MLSVLLAARPGAYCFGAPFVIPLRDRCDVLVGNAVAICRCTYRDIRGAMPQGPLRFWGVRSVPGQRTDQLDIAARRRDVCGQVRVELLIVVQWQFQGTARGSHPIDAVTGSCSAGRDGPSSSKTSLTVSKVGGIELPPADSCTASATATDSSCGAQASRAQPAGAARARADAPLPSRRCLRVCLPRDQRSP